MPSLWRESLGRVAVEAMANGIPVLASDRGALRETMGVAGFVFSIPARYTPDSLEIPTAREIAPWIAVIEKLWDDPEFEARHRALARAEANLWEPAVIADQFVERNGDAARILCQSLLLSGGRTGNEQTQVDSMREIWCPGLWSARSSWGMPGGTFHFDR
jgi:Glycosyl transferases group 1